MDNTSEMEMVQSPKRQREEDDEVKRVPKKRKVKKSQSIGLEQASPSLSSSTSLSPPPKSRSNAKTRPKAKVSEGNTTPEENTSPKAKALPKAKKKSDVTIGTSTRTRKKAQSHTNIRSSSEVSTPTPEPEPESIPRESRESPKPRNPAHLTMIPLEIFHKILTEMTRSESNKRINLRRPNTFNHYFHPLKSTCWKLRKEVDQYIGIKSSIWEDSDLFIDEPRNHDRSESIFHHKDPRYMMLQEEENYDLDIKEPILVHNKKIGTFNPESTWFRFRWDDKFRSEAYMDRVFSNIIDPNNLLDNIQNLTLEFPISRLKEELYAGGGGVSVSQDQEMPVQFQERRPPRSFPELGHFADLKNLDIIIRHDENLSSLCTDPHSSHEERRIRVFDARFDIARRLLGCLYESLVRRKSDRFMPMPLEHVKITGTNEVHIGPEDNRWSVKIPYIKVFEKFKEGSLPAGYNILRLVNHMYKDPNENYHLISMDLCENLR